MDDRLYFIFGDLFSNCAVGALVGLVLAGLVGDGWNMLLAMLVGMGMGMILGLPLAIVLVASSRLGTLQARLLCRHG